MNKLITLVLLVAVVLSACAAPAAPTAAPAPAATAAPEQAEPAADPVKGKTIGFINAGPDDYYAQFGKTLKAVAETYGMNVIEVNSDYKPEKELANVQDLAAKGVDAIAVITAGAAGSAASIKAANDANIPIFFIAGKPELPPGGDLTGHVTDNFVILGYQIGQWVAKNYPNTKCVEIPGFLGQGPAEGQIVGFQMALDEAGYGECKVLKSGEWQSDKSIPITQDLIASGEPFDVMFGANGETVRGVLQVFNELDVKDKVVVSINGKEDEWQWLKDGKEMASVPNPPSLNADLSVQQMVKFFKGEPFEKYLQIKPFAVITKDNVGEAIPWDTANYITGRAANTFKYDLGYYEDQYRQNKANFEKFDAELAAYMNKNAAPAEPKTDAAKGKTIGFINAGPDDYYAQFGKTLKAVAETYGMNVIEVNSDYKPEKELANVQDLAAKGVDAIAVITAGAAGSAASIKAANDANIPIFFIAGKPELPPGGDLTGHVTDNFVILGYQIGQWVAENYPNTKCVEIPGFLGQGPAEGQIVGFQMALDEAGYGECKVLKSGEWQSDKSIPIVQDLIASGEPFDVMFGANGETVRGVLQVFSELDVKDKVVVSINGKEDEWQWLKDGKEMASVPNPPSLNADLSVQQMVKFFNGEPFEKYLQIKPFAVITKDNVGEAIPWDTANYITGRAANTFKYDLGYYEDQYRQNKANFEKFDAELAAYMNKQ